MAEVNPTKPAYECTYWVNREKCIALCRINDLVVQGWKAMGRDVSQDFEHSHFQTTYPSKERLDDYLKEFEPSNVDEFLQYQFTQHQLDDYFRKKANDFQDRRYQAIPTPPLKP